MDTQAPPPLQIALDRPSAGRDRRQLRCISMPIHERPGKISAVRGAAGGFLSSLAEAFFLSRRERYDWKAMGVSVATSRPTAVSLFLPLVDRGAARGPGWATGSQRSSSIPGSRSCCSSSGRSSVLLVSPRGRTACAGFGAITRAPFSNDLNLSAAYRIGMFGKLTGRRALFRAMVWLGFSPRIVMATLDAQPALSVLDPRDLDPESWAGSNTSSIRRRPHRVHHAANLEYLDANYGGVLIISTGCSARISRSATICPAATASFSRSRATTRSTSSSIMDRTGARPRPRAQLQRGARPFFSCRPAGVPTVKAARPRNCAGARSSRNRRS